MSRKSAVSLLVLAFGVSMAAPALLAQGETDYPAGEPSQPSLADKPAEKSDFMRKEAKGSVVFVSPADRTLVVLEAEKKLSLTFIVADPVAKDLSNIKGGDEVTVQYIEDGQTIIAQEITKNS